MYLENKIFANELCGCFTLKTSGIIELVSEMLGVFWTYYIYDYLSVLNICLSAYVVLFLMILTASSSLILGTQIQKVNIFFCSISEINEYFFSNQEKPKYLQALIIIKIIQMVLIVVFMIFVSVMMFCSDIDKPILYYLTIAVEILCTIVLGEKDVSLCFINLDLF